MKKLSIISWLVLSIVFTTASSSISIDQFCSDSVAFSNIELIENKGELILSYDSQICRYGCDMDICKVCTDTIWIPDPSGYCQGTLFTQTSDCGNTRTIEGTKQPDCPDASLVGCGQQIYSLNECGICRGVGTYCREGVCQNGECYVECIDAIWTPDTSTICNGVEFQQTSNCGNTRTIEGTKQPRCVDPTTILCGELVYSLNECEGCRETGTYCREGICQDGRCLIEPTPTPQPEEYCTGYGDCSATTIKECYQNERCKWVNSLGQQIYYFEYPEDKQSGYYTVPCYWIPQDKTIYCNECLNDGRVGCAKITDVRNLYTINEGYTEDFTYQSIYPIYGSWDMDKYLDFTGKCFVGDCNKANLRHTICIDESGNLNVETSQCNKWVATYGHDSMEFCVDNTAYSLGYGLLEIGTCKKPSVVNFYYIWNNNPDYEGYSSDWQSRWSEHFEELRQEMSQYNIDLEANFYEYQLLEDTYIPAVYPKVTSQHSAFNNNGDIHITIKAGKEHPINYGYGCNLEYGGNPCESSATSNIVGISTIQIPDYYDTERNQGFYALVHEFGHTLGCPHTGEQGSLAAHLYMGDWMSYGYPENMFKYECRLGMWYYGQN